MAKIKISLEAQNIGVHSNLKSNLDVDSCRLGVYATNGSGKTFLSKAFHLYSKSTRGKTSLEDVARLLTFDQASGKFMFRVENVEMSDVSVCELRLDASLGITGSTQSKYLFHVFNTDYVRENLGQHNFTPDGKIDGVILGKENIDVSKEEDELKAKKAEKVNLQDELSQKVTKAKNELRGLGIKDNVNEFKQLTLENLLSPKDVGEEQEKYDILLEQFNKLNSMPEDLADVTNFAPPMMDDLFAEIESLFLMSYSRNQLAEDFKSKIRSKINLIKLGVDLAINKTCPFCEQSFTPSVLELIDRYNQYLNDEEAIVIAKTEDLSKRLTRLQENCNKAQTGYLGSKVSYEKIRQYLPPSEATQLNEIDGFDGLAGDFAILQQLLIEKSVNVAKVVHHSFEEALARLSAHLKALGAVCHKNAEIINAINTKKSGLKSQKLNLKRKLCLSSLQALKTACEDRLKRYDDASKRIAHLEADIKEKLNKNKRGKKDEVVRTLKESLSLFFGDKYSFDEKKFCLTLRDQRLSRNANDVLSDGEKSIVAFCYYLATTHCIVESDDDYQRLFFIIDDPISSMDFHYVYGVSQCIRSLGKYFPLIGERLRFLIFTHNLEFISILGRNNICNNTYLLRDGEINRATGTSILPYEEHLNDIVQVSKGIKIANHTTANSIRHILETINKFVAPSKGFETFYSEITEFEADPYLWTLFQDQSHGGIRTQPAYHQEQIKNACALVVKYIENRFEGQIRKMDV